MKGVPWAAKAVAKRAPAVVPPTSAFAPKHATGEERIAQESRAPSQGQSAGSGGPEVPVMLEAPAEPEGVLKRASTAEGADHGDDPMVGPDPEPESKRLRVAGVELETQDEEMDLRDANFEDVEQEVAAPEPGRAADGPQTVEEARSKEIAKLVEFDVFESVPRPGRDTKVLPTTWVETWKATFWKARFCAQDVPEEDVVYVEPPEEWLASPT
eukprot:6046717-Amphidinium_carterae.2